MQNYFDNEATTSVHATMKPARSGKCLVTFSTYEDRQEALNRTTMMDDPTTFRAKGVNKQNKFDATENHNDQTGQEENNSQIPKPPPMQLPNNNLKTQHPPQKSQTLNTQSLYSNDQHNVSLRSSNGAFGGQGSETQYRNSNRNSVNPSAVVNPTSNNRQTLRLGTVTIGEYHNHNSRKEPEKFDFIAPPATKRNDSGATTPTNETLHSELHSTLSRSKLKSNNGSALEHQRNCPLHHQQQQHSHHQPQRQSQSHHHHQQHQQPQHLQYDYQNVNFNNNTFTVSEMTKKLQKTSINGGGGGGGAGAPYTMGGSNHASTGVGILKNGNRNSSSNNSSNKSTEKTIKFG